MFDTEIAGLRTLITNCEAFCHRHGYGDVAARSFIEGRCRSYVEILAPVAAAKPELYDILVKERPSLAPFLSERLAQHFATIPLIEAMEHELTTVLASMNAQGFSQGTFNMADVATVQIMLHKYGFAQELMAAIHTVRPVLLDTLFRFYDMRLRSAQTIDDPADRPEDR